MNDYYITVLMQIFRLVLAAIAFTAIIVDNMKHRDLKLVFFAYACLVLALVASIFSQFTAYIEQSILSLIFIYSFHVLGIALASLLFFLTAFLSHRKMAAIEQRTKEALKR